MKTMLLALALLGPLLQLDAQAQRAVQRCRTPWLERPMRTASEVGRPVTVLGILLGVAVLDPRLGVPAARVALLALVPTNISVEVLKRGTVRTRPDGERSPSNSSFPSSHAANAFALAAVLQRRWRRGGMALLAVAAVIAFSRTYLNRHYPLDVAAGAALGLLWAWAAEALYRRMTRPRAPARSSHRA